jgi:hypothetical protein
MSSTASLLLMGANTATQFSASQQQAGAVLAQGQYQNRIAQYNANLAELDAQNATRRGAQAAQRSAVDTNQRRGASRAAFAAQGIDVNSGSAADTQSDLAEIGALDALTIQNNAAREAFGYRSQGAQEALQGKFALQAARNTASSLTTQSYSTLLTGVGQGYDYWQRYRSTTPSPTISARKDSPSVKY